MASSSMLRLRSTAAKVSPSLMLPAYKMYNLSEEKVVNIKNVEEDEAVVGSSHGWLGLLKEEGKRSSSVSLWNPMSGSRIKLPPLDTIALPQYYNMSVENFIVDDQECGRAIWIGPCANFLALCCPGRCNEWTLFGSRICYDELLYSRHHKLVFCLESNIRELEGWDVSDPRKPRLEWRSSLWDLGWHFEDPRTARPERWLHKLMHLVSSPVDGDCSLFLITRHVMEEMGTHGSSAADDWNSNVYPYKTIAFDVRRIRIHTREMSYMEGSLDGLIMFVGRNHSFAVSAADYPHLKPDSIYFTDHVYYDMFRRNIYGGHDIGIYDYKRGTISACYYPTLHQSLKQNQPPPFWFTPTSKY